MLVLYSNFRFISMVTEHLSKQLSRFSLKTTYTEKKRKTQRLVVLAAKAKLLSHVQPSPLRLNKQQKS